MKTRIALFLVILLFPVTAFSITTAEIYNESKASIVLLLVYDKYGIPLSLGSGFFVEENKIVTNFHVVDGASKVTYQILDSETQRNIDSISSHSKSLDLAILSTKEKNKPLVVKKVLHGNVGDKVLAIGNPKGLTGSVSEGIISAIRTFKDITFLQITTPISPGSSGGPLFDESGEVIGITTATLRDSQNLNFAIPSHLIFTLKEKGTNWEPIITSEVLRTKTGRTGIALVEPRIKNMYGGQLVWSIKNNTQYNIKNLAYLLVFRNAKNREVLHYEYFHEPSDIPSGLAKRKENWIQDMGGYLVQGQNTYPYSKNSIDGFFVIELRVLTYDITGRAQILQKKGKRGCIDGIIYGEDNPTALIGDRIVHEGDTIGGITIVKIYKDRVEFEKKGTAEPIRWTQKVGEAPNPHWE